MRKVKMYQLYADTTLSAAVCQYALHLNDGRKKMERRSGRCRCGQVEFAVVEPTLVTMACHCTGCQQMTGSAFSLSELYALDAFEVTSGEPVIGGMKKEPKHFFCPECKSWIFTRPDEVGSFVNVRATMMEGAREFIPFIETYTDEMIPWASTGATHRFAKFPSADDFPKLIEAYAQL